MLKIQHRRLVNPIKDDFEYDIAYGIATGGLKVVTG